MYTPLLYRLTALALGISLLAAPAAALTPAVSAPAPTSRAVDLTSEYLRFSAAAEGLHLSPDQKHVLWARMDDALLLRLEQGEAGPEELVWLTLPHFRSDRAERYAAWAASHPALTAQQVVTEVNLDRDQAFYSSVRPVSDPRSTLVLVNKHYALASDFAPELELLGSGYGKGSLQPEAARQFRAMADAARADGISLRSVSAYRSYSTQRYTYNTYLAQYSQGVVDNFSARPGHSEHQTGLALDINAARTSAHFENTAAYAWLQENCARFGFILRYPQDKTHITGYRFEPWHYRYVGTAAAAVCMKEGLTWEEFIARLPAEDPRSVPPLLHAGALLNLGDGALMLEGQAYLSASALANAVGLDMQWSAGRLILDGRVVLSPGLYAQADGAAVRLVSPALLLEHQLYLTREDLAALLGLDLTFLLP